jgi:endo-1,4-beta-xylanase
MKKFDLNPRHSIRAAFTLLAAITFAGTFVFAQNAPTVTTPAASVPNATSPTTQPVKLFTPEPLIPGATVITLWPEGSPKLRAARGSDAPEQFNTPANAQLNPNPTRPNHVNYVINIHNPSIEVHLAPKEKANGMSIILAAGGGNTTENVGWEGTDLLPWFADHGIAVFIERYRIRPYSSATDALYDTQRSFKVIRAHAKEWGIDPTRVGIMGFSAGGEQAARVALNYDKGVADDADPIEHESSRPDYVVLIYAGWGRMSFTQVPKDAPPAFCAVAGADDLSHSTQTMDFVNAWLRAGIPTELHIYGHGGHANAMQPRKGIPFGTWQYRFVDWANDLGLMNADRTPVPASESTYKPGGR